MNIEKAKQELAAHAKKLHDAGILTGKSPILSARSEDKVLTISGNFEKPSVVEVSVISLNGLRHEEGPLPSALSFLHAALMAKKKFTVTVQSFEPAVLTSSRAGLTVYPLLDDLAQIAGASIKCAPYFEKDILKSAGSAQRRLRRRSAVLIHGMGGLCGAENFDDAGAVAQVLEKGCRAFIESSFLGGGVKINMIEANLMRLVYRIKYSKSDSTNI